MIFQKKSAIYTPKTCSSVFKKKHKIAFSVSINKNMADYPHEILFALTGTNVLISGAVLCIAARILHKVRLLINTDVAVDVPLVVLSARNSVENIDAVANRV